MVGVVTYHQNKCSCPSETLMNLYKTIFADRQNLNEPNLFGNADMIYSLPVLNNVLVCLGSDILTFFHPLLNYTNVVALRST